MGRVGVSLEGRVRLVLEDSQVRCGNAKEGQKPSPKFVKRESE